MSVSRVSLDARTYRLYSSIGSTEPRSSGRMRSVRSSQAHASRCAARARTYGANANTGSRIILIGPHLSAEYPVRPGGVHKNDRQQKSRTDEEECLRACG